MAITTASAADILAPGLWKIWGTTYKRYPKQYTRFFDMRTSKRAYEESLGFGNFGLFQIKPEGKSVSYADLAQLYKNRATHITYALGYQITSEMIEDDLYNVINKFPEALASSQAITEEIVAMSILNNGFSSGTVYADGVALFSASHPIKGGVFSNKLAVPMDLDITSLELAYIDIANMVDDAGNIIHAQKKQLIIGPPNEFQAIRLFKSVDDPSTANRSTNPVHGSLEYTVSNFLTEPDNWFIQTDVPDGLICYNRLLPVHTRDVDTDTDSAKFKSKYRQSFTVDNPRAIYGSAGSNNQ